MKQLVIAMALVFGVIGPPELNPCTSGAALAQQSACCKVCRKGKACGDSCISADKQCHKGAGCACDG